ncbi:hypothetical protein [Oceanicaulis sp. MMSF_3324]|uniref:hypothetical protein n=1 Tax=Oceanicaulis sp. MMSF_3324 TaxID=3046702 RepID=UPI00273F0116|nr:hypothetical protein [Oceanicaulis sp. MMSF_3324]
MKTRFGALSAGVLAIAALAGSALAQDYTEPPSFGRVSLSSGFTPDPYVRNLTAGGPIRAQDRFSECRGYIANAPDFSINYTSGSFPLIFTVDSDTDTTLVINGPDARWYCDDDGAESPLNPMVRFSNPQSGRYDIWVGTYSRQAGQPATLFVSELGEHTRDGQSGGMNYGGGLDISLPSRFADITLNGGFLPDPYQLRLTAGGSVAVSDAVQYATGSCRGYVTREPSVELDYTGYGDLYIYTSGDADTTLVINGPDGQWYCSDDEIGTDAGLDFTNATQGVYDIYVGTYSRGDRQTTLMISEIEMGYQPARK